MRDWDAIAKTYQAFLESYSRPEARARLSAILGAPVGDDVVDTHAALRKLLRLDVETALSSLGLYDKRARSWLDGDRRAFFRLSMIDELLRMTHAPHFTAKQRAAIESIVDRLRPKPMGPELDDIIPEQRTYVGDSECVDAAKDYEHLVRDLLGLAELEPTSVTCREVKDHRRHLTVTIAKRSVSADLRGNTDWVDPEPLIACLNKAVPARSTRRFHLVSRNDWGQELGVVFASKAEVRRLRGAKYVIDDDDDPDDDSDDEP